MSKKMKDNKNSDVTEEIQNPDNSESEQPIELESGEDISTNKQEQISDYMAELENLRSTVMEEIESLKRERKIEVEKKQAEIINLKQQIANDKVHEQIRALANENGFISPDDVAIFLSGKIEQSDDEIKMDGRKVPANKLKSTLDRVIKELASSKPYLVSPDWRSGSGARPSNTGEETSRKAYDFRKSEDRKRFEEELKKRGLPLLNPLK